MIKFYTNQEISIITQKAEEYKFNPRGLPRTRTEETLRVFDGTRLHFYLKMGDLDWIKYDPYLFMAPLSQEQETHLEFSCEGVSFNDGTTTTEYYVECVICKTDYLFENERILCNGKKYKFCPYCVEGI